MSLHQAIHLPQHLLSKWVAASAPHLDFISLTCTVIQAGGMSHTQPQAVQSLQVNTSSAMHGHCSDMGFSVSSFVRADKRFDELLQFVDKMCNSIACESTHMLGALEEAVSHMTHLQHLGLHDLHVSPQLLPALQ